MNLFCDSVFLFLAVYPREIETYVYCPQKKKKERKKKDLYKNTALFIAALFIITSNWKQVSINRRMVNKPWYIHLMV